MGTFAVVPRPEPLAPTAAVAEGCAARRLARRLLQLGDAALARLVGVAGPGLLAVLGAEAELPWIDGIRYLGRDPDAPALYLPTALTFDVPLALVEGAFLAAATAGAAPFAVLLEPPHQGTAGGAAFGRPFRLEPPHQGTAGGAAFGRPFRLEPPRLVPLGAARPVERARLSLWLERTP